MSRFTLQKNYIKYSFFSFIFIVAITACLELSLYIVGYNPYIKFQNMQIPYWVSKEDPVFLSDYKRRLKSLGKINHDLYAYSPNRIFGYLLKLLQTLLLVKFFQILMQ